MRIGYVPVLSGAGGGIYQYSHSMLETLVSFQNETDEYIAFAHDTEHPSLKELPSRGWDVWPLFPPTISWKVMHAMQRLAGEDRSLEWWAKLQNLKARFAGKPRELSHLPPVDQSWFHQCGAELMIYPWPSSLSFESGVPYIFTVHDLQHRVTPEFNEVSAQGEWEQREYRFINGCKFATLIIADSEVGKDDILRFYGEYGVTADRVKVLPYLPGYTRKAAVPAAERERVRTDYSLPETFLFYPAQFWPHKNHARIIEALGRLKERRQLEIPIVLCGSRSGKLRSQTHHQMMSLARSLGVEEHTHVLGYVPDLDMPGLYAQANALIMPSLFGTAILPVLEAWSFGVPVLASDLRGVREQVGDAALLVNPQSVDDIAEGICRLWTDAALRTDLIESGRQRVNAYTPADYRKRLGEILTEAKEMVLESR